MPRNWRDDFHVVRRGSARASPSAPPPPAAGSLGELAFTAAAWLYLALLPCSIRLAGPFFVHDLLAPVFAVAVLWRGEWDRWRRSPDVFLAAFGIWCTAVTLLRHPRAPDLYELAVFAYMGLLYAFFSRTRLAPHGLGLYAAAVALGLWVVGAVQAVSGGVQPHAAYVGTALGFLATRYAFTFGNPNLFASFAVLPVACALLAAESPAGQGTDTHPPRLLRLALLAAALGVPLLLAASRHLLLSFALALAGSSALLPSPYRPRARRAAWALLACVFVPFYLTVLVPTFPLQATFPFLNLRTPGMYLIHQDAYLRLATADLPSLLLGPGRSAVLEGYRHAVDPDLAHRVLAEYRMDHLTPSFLAYMDAHNEFLNLATAFGLPALVLLGAFLASLLRRSPGLSAGMAGALIGFLVVAIGLACLWDDLLSKRWLWVVLGLLVASAGASSGPAPDTTGTPQSGLPPAKLSP